MPSLERGAMLFSLHWRKMPLAFHDLSADAKKLTTSIALRTSETEVQWSVPMGSGERWTPDARVWNMSEGSFNQREALFAPTPAKIAFRLTPPPNAKLVFSPGTANANGDATVFSVSVTDARGTKTTPYEKRFLPEQTSSWIDDESVDLSAFAGQSIELELQTRAEARKADEAQKPRWHPPVERGDAGPPAPAEAKGASGLSLALWGNPEILAHEPDQGALQRSLHRRRRAQTGRHRVLPRRRRGSEEARELAPAARCALAQASRPHTQLDAIAARGVRFTHAYSAATWTRPGTVAMLVGQRSTELGLDSLPGCSPTPRRLRFYRSDPSMLPLLLRREGVATRAFVNNYFMVGYAAVGVDMGFERVDDYRYRTRDTRRNHDARARVARSATRTSASSLFCNYNSPHEPLEPPARFLDKIPDPPAAARATRSSASTWPRSRRTTRPSACLMRDARRARPPRQHPRRRHRRPRRDAVVRARGHVGARPHADPLPPRRSATTKRRRGSPSSCLCLASCPKTKR